MQEQYIIPVFSSTKEAQNSICSESVNNESKNANFFVSSSSNFSSFNSHITACSSPYTNSFNTYSRQPSKLLLRHHNNDGRNQSSHNLNGGSSIFITDNFNTNKLSKFGVHLDKRLITLLLTFISIIIVIYKMVIVTVPYVKSECLADLKKFAETCYHEALTWANEHNINSIMQPLICGLAVAILGYTLVYLDSNIPGICPPSPFSPRKELLYYQKKSSIHLGYITAISVGIVIAVFLYLDAQIWK